MAKNSKSSSGCDEDLHPLLLDIINTFCLSPPIATVTSLVKHDAERQDFDLKITQILIQLEEWIQENRELVEVLGEMCPGAKVIDLENGKFAMMDFYITPEIEEDFLIKKKDKESSTERLLRLKRDKLISALSALMSLANIEIFQEKNDVNLLKIFCATLAFQLIRFAAGFAISDGLDRQKKRRSRKGEKDDREGLLALLHNFDKQYPDKTPLELWKIVTNFLITKKIYRPKKGYSVHFEIEPTNTGDKGGRIMQTKPKQKPHPMGFQAFTRALDSIRT